MRLSIHQHSLLSLILLLTGGLALSPRTWAGSVTVDTSFGRTGQTLGGPNYSIPASLGKTVGNNLFHSFSQFDLSSGDVATFYGLPNVPIQNVLARVTGGNASSIDGTIKTDPVTLSGANFFLTNPSGLIFGPNANVLVGGSFVATTANYLKLADGVRFVAALNGDDSVLSSAPVSAFGFVGSSPAGVSLQQSSLALSDGKNLSIVSGDIGVDGATLKAPVGRVNLVSVRSAGEVALDATDVASALDVSTFSQLGQVAFQNAAAVEVSGEGGGNVAIRGGKLTMKDRSTISAETTGSVQGGDIDIETGSVDLSRGAGISVSTSGTAKGGNVVIETGSFELTSGATIDASTLGLSDGGNVKVTASSVVLDGTGNTFSPSTGISTESGSSNTALLGHGKGGDIIVGTGSLEILHGALISASTLSLGTGGHIQLAADTIRVDGVDPRDSRTGSGVLAQSGSTDISLTEPVDGGNIDIVAGSLALSNHARISASGKGTGNGGDVTIQASTVSLEDAAGIESTGAGQGRAGRLTLTLKQSLRLDLNSALLTFSHGNSGGDISVTAGSKIVVTKSQISTAAGIDGGNITLNSPSLIYLLNSAVSAQADQTKTGHGNGGNINVDPSFLILNRGQLISKASKGNGGNISILSDFFFASDSVIDASAPFGLPGTVEVTAPNVDLSGSLVGLSSSFLDAEARLQESCALRFAGGISSFIVVGRGGMLVEQGGLLNSFQLKGTDAEK